MGDIKELRGACLFCGQYIVLSDEEEMPESMIEADRLATMQCSCMEAREFQRKVKRSASAKTKVQNMFGNNLQEQYRAEAECIELLKDCIDLLIDGRIAKVSIDLPMGVKAKISMSAEGKIRIERSLTQKQKDSE